MKIIVEREVLLAALSFVAKYAETRATIPILTHAKFEADANRLSITATNLEMSARDSIAAHVTAPGAICLPHAPLLAIIKNTDASEIQIEADERQASIKVGARTSLKLPVMLADDFANVGLDLDPQKVEGSFVVDAGLLECWQREVAIASSKDGVNFLLMGTAWSVHAGKLELWATNRAMLSMIAAPAPAGCRIDAIVPNVPLPEWGGEIAVSHTSGRISFSSGNQVVTSKLIDGTFPDFRGAIAILKEPSATPLFDRAEFVAAVARMAIVADAKEHSVLIVGRDGKATLSARTPKGEVSDGVAYDGDDFQVAIAHGVLAPLLRSFQSEMIEMLVIDHQSPIIIRDRRDETRTAFAQPYRDGRIAEYLPATKQAA